MNISNPFRVAAGLESIQPEIGSIPGRLPVTPQAPNRITPVRKAVSRYIAPITPVTIPVAFSPKLKIMEKNPNRICAILRATLGVNFDASVVLGANVVDTTIGYIFTGNGVAITGPDVVTITSTDEIWAKNQSFSPMTITGVELISDTPQS